MQGVRPTKRALGDLGLGFPRLTSPLNEIKNSVIIKAQELPAAYEAGSAERIKFVTDRYLFKVKITNWRGAAGVVETPQGIGVVGESSAWWLMAAGQRQADSRTQDFYDALQAECKRAARGRRTVVDSSHLLPTGEDYRRLEAEIAARVVDNIKVIVREVICRSAQTGARWEHEVSDHRIAAEVTTTDGTTYLAITASGFVDPKILAVILDAVPGVQPEDWGLEPGEVLGITPQHDQMVFSTILPPQVLSSLLEEHDRNHL